MNRLMMSIGALLAIALSGVTDTAAAGEDMFPFPVQTLNTNRDATDMSWMNECPAGKHGFVTVKNGHFADGAGKRIRFLGFNLCSGGAFPERAYADLLAARLAKLGVNCIRIHHGDMNYAPKGIWDPKFADKQHIHSGQLDKLDYLIAALKRHGIYVNLNLHVSRKFTAADGFPEANGLPKYDKGVDNFEPRMIRLQMEFAKNLLTHLNPYTGIRYTDEPSVAIIEINNENSLLEYCIDGTIATIPPYYQSQLRKLWNDWLKKRYSSTTELHKAWGGVPEPIGDNVLPNSDLSSGTANWTLQAPSPAEATMVVADDGPQPGIKSIHAAMTREGSQPWHFQVHQMGLDLAEGKPYVLRFWARANQPRRINAEVRLDTDPWSPIGLMKTIELPVTWKCYEISFIVSGTVPSKRARVSFNLQNAVGDVWLAGVELRRGGAGTLPAAGSLEAGRVNLPTDAYTAAQRADFLSFAAEIERGYARRMYDYIKKSLGSKSLVIDTQVTFGGIGGMYRESLLDFCDIHMYWQHPSFPNKPWDPNDWRIRNTSMVSEFGADTLTRMAMCRIARKPFTVGEYNHPAPNDYSAECVPMLAAFAALQDWDGIMLFDYHSSLDDWDRDRITGFFSCDSHPAKITMMPAAAAIFRRADVSPLSASAVLEFPVSLITKELRQNASNWPRSWTDCGFNRTEALSASIAARFADSGDKTEVARATSKTAPDVTWTCEKGHEQDATFIINAPASRGVVGFPSAPVTLAGLTIEAKPGRFSAITVTSLDGKPIERSGHLLIAAVGRVENTGMGWNEARTTVGSKWGSSPVVAEGVTARITVEGKVTRAESYALDGGGGRMGTVAWETTGSDLALDLGPQYRTLWYEVVIER